jgi:hypothetical protein
VVSFDPLNPPTSFDLIDLASGSFPFATIPFGGAGGGTPSAQGTGHGIDMQLFDGSLEAMFAPANFSSANFRSVELFQKANRGGTNYNARYTILHSDSSASYLQVNAYGLRSGSSLEVFGRESNGKMTLIGKQSLTNDFGWTLSMPNVTGYTTYKTVIYGSVLDPIGQASMDVYSSPYSWGYGIVGKGGVQAEP